MNNEINKALHGVIRPDGCYHEFEDISNTCKNCNTHMLIYHNPDYFSKEGFWDAWEWAREQDWWDLLEQRHDGIPDRRFYALHLSLIDYKTFAKHLYDFLVSEGIIK